MEGVVIHQAIPFDYNIPNKETIKAIEDARMHRNLSKAYTNVDELIEDLNK